MFIKSFWCISYLVAAVSLQSLWSLVLAVVDIYALLVKRSLRSPCVVSLFTIGDGVRNLMSFFNKTAHFKHYETVIDGSLSNIFHSFVT